MLPLNFAKVHCKLKFRLLGKINSTKSQKEGEPCQIGYFIQAHQVGPPRKSPPLIPHNQKTFLALKVNGTWQSISLTTLFSVAQAYVAKNIDSKSKCTVIVALDGNTGCLRPLSRH